MGKALYRKYRSRGLDEVVGQDHITTTLRNALATGKIAHAYLLTGPRGVGKTSIARILAHEINGLAYSEEPHFDIIEIDAASNNGVEDVRDLRDKIMSAPASATYKVFIIDEVHMLSKAAFNALLKTLEEPPEHVVFILATTEAHKLPETIISRTQRYSFRPASAEKIIENLRSIAKKEKIVIDNDALETIAEHSDGSFRDSVSLLDQASSVSDHITRSQVEQLLGRAPSEHIDGLLFALETHDTSAGLQSLHALREQGYEPAMVAMQLGQSIRSKLIGDSGGPQSITLLRDLLDVPPAHNPQALLELVVMKYSAPSVIPAQNVTGVAEQSQVKERGLRAEDKGQSVPSEEVKVSDEKNEVAVEIASLTPVQTETTEKITTNISGVESTEVPAPKQEADGDTPETPHISDSSSLWQAVLQDLKQTHNTLYGIARMARPLLEGNKLTLELNFAFHQKRLTEPKNRSILTNLVERLRGEPTEVHCVTVTAAKPAAATNDAVATISNIFGGAELLES